MLSFFPMHKDSTRIFPHTHLKIWWIMFWCFLSVRNIIIISLSLSLSFAKGFRAEEFLQCSVWIAAEEEEFAQNVDVAFARKLRRFGVFQFGDWRVFEISERCWFLWLWLDGEFGVCSPTRGLSSLDFSLSPISGTPIELTIFSLKLWHRGCVPQKVRNHSRGS